MSLLGQLESTSELCYRNACPPPHHHHTHLHPDSGKNPASTSSWNSPLDRAIRDRSPFQVRPTQGLYCSLYLPTASEDLCLFSQGEGSGSEQRTESQTPGEARDEQRNVHVHAGALLSILWPSLVTSRADGLHQCDQVWQASPLP